VATNPAYPDSDVRVERQRTFGATAEATPMERKPGKYGGTRSSRKPPMGDFFKRAAATPEEDSVMDQDRAAGAIEPEAPEIEVAPEAEAPEADLAEAPEGIEGEDESEGESSAGRRVPLGELLSERERRKQAQSEREAMAAKLGQLENTFSKVMERLNAPSAPAAPAADPIPAYDSDPIANLAARLEQIERYTVGHGQQLGNQQALVQFQNALAGHEASFRSQTPDYDAAVNFAKNQRDAELAAFGYSPAERHQLITQEILGISASALNRGANPAELFYNYAKMRGWANAAPQPQASPTKLATVARAQSATRSPRGGAAPRAGLSLEDLAGMDDGEFDAAFDKFWRRT